MSQFGTPDVAKLRTDKDVTGLIQALGYQADARVQGAAAQALVSIGAPAVEPLIAVLKADQEVRGPGRGS